MASVDISKILSDIQNAKRQGITSQDFDKLSKTLSDVSKQNATADAKLRAAFTDANERLMDTLIPSKDALLAAATSASPAVAAIMSLWNSQQKYRQKIDSRAEGEHKDLIAELNKQLQQLKIIDENQDSPVPEEVVTSVNETNTLLLENSSIQQRQLEMLIELYKVWDSGDNPMVAAIEKQSEETSKYIEQMKSDAEAERLKMTEGQPEPKTVPVAIPEKPEKDNAFSHGLLGGALAGIGGLSGLLGGLASMAAPLAKVTKFLKVGPLALITSVYEFGSGFFDAKEILQKSDVTIAERLQAGAIQLVGSLGEIIDMGLSLAGFDTDLSGTLRTYAKKILDYPVALLNKVTGTVAQAFEGIDSTTDISDIPGIIYDNVTNMVKKLVERITDLNLIENAKEKVGSIKDSALEALDTKIEAVKGTVSGFFTGLLESMLDKLLGLADYLPDFLGGEALKKKIIEARDEMLLDVKPSGVNKAKKVLDSESELQQRETSLTAQPQSLESSTLNNQNNVSQVNSSTTINPRLNTTDFRDRDFAGPQHALRFSQ